MKTKLLLAAAISALSLGAAGAQAAPASVPALNDIATQGSGVAVEQAHHGFNYGYYNYYYYNPYYYYPRCYWSYGFRYCY
jgi:hypothetical protein